MTETMHRTDHELKVAILDEFAWTPRVNADRIGVAVNDQAITLSGEVRSYPEKTAAVKAAHQVSGVTAVADEIVVQHGLHGSNDADIARQAAGALDRTITVPPGSVKVTVHNHTVTLTGEVAWQYQRQTAQHALAALRGVTWVDNKIDLRPTDVLDPAEAKARLNAALVRNALVDADSIDITVDGASVSLSGAVRNLGERHQAELAAWSTPGVTEVHNRLTVRPAR
jgi:osmotically-inducible protein OsmY